MKLKNKKGFTLIELLAVIVVLAIIALIATPIVMNTIKRSKKGAAERSADSYVKQVEVAIMEAKLENNSTHDGEYSINENGNLTGRFEKDNYKCNLAENAETYEEYLKYSEYCDLEERTLVINMNGTKPSSGKIVIENDQVSLNNAILTIDGYSIGYKNNKKTVIDLSSELSKFLCVYVSGTSAYNYGSQYICELGDGEQKAFYLLEESGDNVSLIMDRNIDSNGKGTTSGNTVEWVSKEDYFAAGGSEAEWNAYNGDNGNNNLGPITALKYLKNSTKNWTKLTEAQISLPSASQLATAVGKTFDGKNYISNISATWLYGNMPIIDDIHVAPQGYWTSTPYESLPCTAWSLGWDRYGAIFSWESGVKDDRTLGVRPVITISKSQLN